MHPSSSERAYVSVFAPSNTLGRRPIPRYLRLAALALALNAHAEESDWILGAYAGKYYDTEPAGFTQGRAKFLEHYLVAVTAKKTVWRSGSWPLSLEFDGMLGLQSGAATLGEVAVAPALRWSGFPWNGMLHTSVSVAPLGISYTTAVNPLELGQEGKGSQILNWLFLELALSNPDRQSTEIFMRLHHRCAVYDLLNNYGANGEDFFVVGLRRRF